MNATVTKLLNDQVNKEFLFRVFVPRSHTLPITLPKPG